MVGKPASRKMQCSLNQLFKRLRAGEKAQGLDLLFLILFRYIYICIYLSLEPALHIAIVRC